MPTATQEKEAINLSALISAAFAAEHAAPPCFNWTACGELAAVEKAGRSVCRGCAAKLCGAEYPLRDPSAESLYASDRLAAQALDMLEERPEGDRATPRLSEAADSDDSNSL